jgi:copper chaperone CopZ
MSGDTCVKRVTGALSSVNGVKTQSVKVGSAKIESDDEGCQAACSAINKSGYKAREGNSTEDANSDLKLTPEVPSAEHKGRNQSGTPIMNTNGTKHEPVAATGTAVQPTNDAKSAPQAKQFGRNS